jgi:hypothetical protein
MIDFLLQKTANVNARNHNLDTPTHLVAKVGSYHAFMSLIQHGANIYAVNMDGISVLTYAYSAVMRMSMTSKNPQTADWKIFLKRLVETQAYTLNETNKNLASMINIL